MIDIHCHLLPGADDGSGSPEESVDMIRLAIRGGTTAIVCTPHCNVPHSYRNYWSPGFAAGITNLQNYLIRRQIPMQIYAGQEVFLDGDMEALLRDGRIMTINHSDYMLVETDPLAHSADVYRMLEKLRAAGIIPVLAHPERYRFVGVHEDAPRILHRIGCLLQVNKGSLLGAFGHTIAKTAHRLVRTRMADCAASDAHSPNMRTPYLRDVHELISEEYSYEYADFLLTVNPGRIVDNRPTERFR